jgi:peptidoglycan/LPS O-acetylase OafA/YrhL
MAQEIRSLTGLRAVAALWVVAYHLRQGANGGIFFGFGPLDPLISCGYVGVDLFFVLSGFVIQHVYREQFATRLELWAWIGFLRHRVARLYPIHLVTLGLMIGLHFTAVLVFDRHLDGAPITPLVLLNNLTLTHEWWFGLGTPNTPAWSISAEWAAYLLFPLLCFGLGHASRLWMLVLVPMSLALVATPTESVTGLVRIAPEFVLGMVLYETTYRWRWGHRGLGMTALGAFVGTIYLHGPGWLQVLWLAVLIGALSSTGDWLGRALARPWPLYLGEISYCIYMVHWFLWKGMKGGAAIILPGVKEASVGFVTTAVALILLAAAILHHTVEVPGRRAIRGNPTAFVPRSRRPNPGAQTVM